MTPCDFISATKKARKQHPKRSRCRSKLPGKEGGDESEEEADDNAPLINASSEARKTGSAPVTQATANTNNTPTLSGCDVVKKALEVIKAKAISLRSSSSKRSHDASTASQLA